MLNMVDPEGILKKPEGRYWKLPAPQGGSVHVIIPLPVKAELEDMASKANLSLSEYIRVNLAWLISQEKIIVDESEVAAFIRSHSQSQKRVAAHLQQPLEPTIQEPEQKAININPRIAGLLIEEKTET